MSIRDVKGRQLADVLANNINFCHQHFVTMTQTHENMNITMIELTNNWYLITLITVINVGLHSLPQERTWIIQEELIRKR